MSKRIILDTNVLVSALTSAEGASRVVLRGVLQGRWQALVSLALFLEYEDVLSRPQTIARCPLPEAEREDLIDAFASCCQMLELHYMWRPNLRDEADNHVFELAVAAQNAVLLTWNLRDFASAELRFPHIRVLTPAQWLASDSLDQ